MALSIQDLMTVTASTKRNADLGSGRTGAAVAYLSSLLVTPLWPVGWRTTQALSLHSPREFKECYHVPLAGVALPDVVEGDILVVAGVDYPVHFTGEWTDGETPTLHIVCQQIKGS